ncbi:hypothetical protein [Helicobacter ailurogastricus]|uniref:Lipoprotein n=1 Tax=Helicobacter ailurogastricus TaxID=1578720 RepID=A0A0K2XB49_9HELI|nr:hypothetical protein [Helicobacter ailurogastricus]CRF41209.1 conserved hypothetical protein with DUF394 domain [Helicobacter ailurogastricus]CRF41914.1 conserved hypothetical protein with DUF394 domain [Helicobacter ailurogastricus]CRF43757.1 conserved hypothetical protein with DUF394 domain [Helicobacter ailurogastricus]
MRENRLLKLVGLCSVSVAGSILVGCAHTASRGELSQFQQAYYAKNHQQADQVSKSALAEDKKQKDAPLWNLESGVNAFMMDQYRASLDTLDKANKTFDTNFKAMEKGIDKVGAATYGSAMNVPYEGHMYEWTLTNYYMALDYAFLGNKQDARVEFNRTIDRERRIKDAYNKELAKAEAEFQKAKQKNASMADKMVAGMSSLDGELKSRFSNLERFSAYNGFINPLVNYVGGLFFANNGDNSKAIDELKEVYGVSHNKIVGEDLKNLMHHSREKYTWVIVEDGMQPTLKEYKIPSLNFALPTIQDGRSFHNSFKIVENGKSENMGVLSNFAIIFQKEYQATLPAIKHRAIASAILKTGTEVALNQGGAAVGGATGAAMQVGSWFMHAANKASTAADTRSSNIFPSMVYLGRVDNKSHKFSIQIDNLHRDFSFVPCNGKAPASGQVCSDTNNIIFVRSFPSDLNVKPLSL